MRLVTFENPAGTLRIGAVAGKDGRIVDLNSACALYLHGHEKQQSAEQLANQLAPSNMRALFEGGDRSLNAARTALDYVLARGLESANHQGNPVSYSSSEVRLKAPILPKKFFHTAGN